MSSRFPRGVTFVKLPRMTSGNETPGEHGGARWFMVRTVSVVLALYLPHVVALFVGHFAECATCRAAYLPRLPVAPGFIVGAVAGAAASRWRPDATQWVALGVSVVFSVVLVASLIRIARRSGIALAWTAVAALFVASAHAWILSVLSAA